MDSGFYNFFKNALFGRPRTEDKYSSLRDDEHYGKQFRSNQGYGEDPANYGEVDATDMPRYFEAQIDQMLRTFGFPSLFEGGSFFEAQDPFSGHIGPGDFNEAPQGHLRDRFLKPGYEHPAEYRGGDKTIDGSVDIGELDTAIKPYNRGEASGVRPQYKSKFFGKQMSTKTVVSADGSTETVRTVRDSQGNEEVTVTKKYGEKEYSVTTRTDSTGKKETHENLINCDESELDLFKNKQPNLPIMDNSDRNIFDRIFDSKM